MRRQDLPIIQSIKKIRLADAVIAMLLEPGQLLSEVISRHRQVVV